MPCLLAIIALFSPRLVILLLAIFSDYLDQPYGSGWIWAILGFFFFPFTTLAYAVAINAYGAVSGMGLILVILGVLFDLGAHGGTASNKNVRHRLSDRG